MTVGLFPMVADVLHAGHILAIKEAREHCDYLIVALYCKPKRKPNIVQSIFERYVQLSAIKYVDEVVPYEDEDDTVRMLLSLQYSVASLFPHAADIMIYFSMSLYEFDDVKYL